MKTCRYLLQVLLLGALCFVGGQELVAGVPDRPTERHHDEAVPTLGEWLILERAMKHGKAVRLLEECGAKRVEGAYPLFWGAGNGKRAGIHEYYNLPNGTCLALRVCTQGVQEPIVEAYGLGPKGKRYHGKIEWFRDEDKGLVKWSYTIRYRLGEPIADGKRPRAPKLPENH